MSASFCRQTETVRYLLEAGAAVTVRNLLLDTCLHLAVTNGDVATTKVIMEVRLFRTTVLQRNLVHRGEGGRGWEGRGGGVLQRGFEDT